MRCNHSVVNGNWLQRARQSRRVGEVCLPGSLVRKMWAYSASHLAVSYSSWSNRCPNYCLAMLVLWKSVAGHWLGGESSFKSILTAVLGNTCLERALLQPPRAQLPATNAWVSALLGKQSPHFGMNVVCMGSLNKQELTILHISSVIFSMPSSRHWRAMFI